MNTNPSHRQSNLIPRLQASSVGHHTGNTTGTRRSYHLYTILLKIQNTYQQRPLKLSEHPMYHSFPH